MSEEILAWYSGLEKLEHAAKEKGFQIETGMQVLSVQKSELLDSPAVHKTMNIEFPGISRMSLSDLWAYQYDDVSDYAGKLFMDLTVDYLEELDKNLSQVIYDERERIRGLLLCRTSGEEIMVELLVGSKKATQFIMAALQGFVIALEKTGEEDKKITMLDATDTVVPLLKRVLNKKYQYRKVGEVHCIKEAADDDFLNALSEAEKDCLYQKNIRWKYPWSLKYHMKYT